MALSKLSLIPRKLALLAILASPFMNLVQVEAQEPKQKVSGLVEEIVTAEVELEVSMRRSKILRMQKDVFRAAVADPSILEFVAFGSKEIEIIGKQTGSTTVTMWLGNEQDAELLSMLVTVVKDDGVDAQRRFEYSELQAMVNEMFPNSRIQLIPIADKVILRGQARDEEEAVEITSIVGEQMGNNNYNNGGNLLGNITASEPFPDASTLPQARLINLLDIPGEKQVLLKVRIAELQRSASRELGADFQGSFKEFTFANGLTGAGNALLTGTFSEGGFDVVLKALVGNGTAKILSEPNLVVLSGESATFLSGGEFAVPTVVGVGGAQAATTSFRGFGTSVDFSPTVLDKDRIRLRVAPSFTTLNKSNSVNGIPGVDSRSTSTVVEMREGQTFAIAGLIQEQQASESSRLPFLGEVPGLNVLTESKSVSRDESELLILVSPELVHPLEPDQAPQILPGMEVTEPNDLDFFLFGDLEGRAESHHRSTVWPLYKSRMKRCGYYEMDKNHKSKKYYLNGSHGFSE
ncbi:type II and III secretion system protein family protein [Thalassoglobus polymorphus]|uniref:Type II secretion system protein D n=1 Tax=Thalassoglobus polymorphus TaxID=2527994 RepID=A0A517QPS9_9PLAN|nr:pilus assembly protein N-terminal domain-containing protein [Thalassoglobus polymorphus]QDT33650.1 Type II secretion system protein D precursor [Thalassoglobus polymorphus]